MYNVRRQRAFVASSIGWTIWVECEGPQLDVRGHLEGVDWREFWRWISDHITQVTDEGEPLEIRDGATQPVGAAIDADPEAWTAERLAGVVLLELRKLSDAVAAVQVIRNPFGPFTDAITEATVRTNERAPVTQAELVAALRRLAQMNPGLVLNAGGR